MSEDVPAIRLRELRGQILDFLHEIYPWDIDKTSIYNTYYQYFEVKTIDQALEYLADKGYIEKSETKGTRLFEKIQRYSITPEGVDLLEGTITDPGVFVRR